MQKTYKDHNGKSFDSISEMCRYWGITKGSFYSRLKMNWSLCKILTTPVADKRTKITDHLGQEFNSVIEMCHHYNINKRTYNTRKSAGWSLKHILTTSSRSNRQKPITDLYGNKFESIVHLANAYGLKPDSVRASILRKKSLAEALRIMPVLSKTTRNFKFDDNLVIIKPIEDDDISCKYFICKLCDHDIILTKEMLTKYCEQNPPYDKNPKYRKDISA